MTPRAVGPVEAVEAAVEAKMEVVALAMTTALMRMIGSDD